ncbi:MAG TPA: hypothetical protein ENN12_03445 [Epsilonproteobacteria bacterium]|nr:hypothetical protein [Campylobacterota bacterium]
MKKIIIIFMLLFSLNASALEPVAFVDMQKFSGLWYEIARTYNSYQEKCVGSSVEYKLVNPFKYEVANRCFDTVIGGKLIEYNGTAKPTKGDNLASIDMTYYRIFTKTYHIYYLSEDYSYVLFADKDFKQLWIMSRKPTMPKEILDEILSLLRGVMNVDELIYTPQDKEGRYK